MSDREVMQQALEALEYGQHSLKQISEHQWESRGHLAMVALRAALAEPEQSPEDAGYVPLSADGRRVFIDGVGEVPLAEPEPEPEPESVAGYRSCPTHCCPVHGCKYGHLGCPVHLGQVKPEYPNNNGCEYCESNPEPEPVAERNREWHDGFLEGRLRERQYWLAGCCMNTTPPARRPLTLEEIMDAVRDADLDWHTGWSLGDDAPNRFITLIRAAERAHGIGGNDE